MYACVVCDCVLMCGGLLAIMNMHSVIAHVGVYVVVHVSVQNGTYVISACIQQTRKKEH